MFDGHGSQRRYRWAGGAAHDVQRSVAIACDPAVSLQAHVAEYEDAVRPCRGEGIGAPEQVVVDECSLTPMPVLIGGDVEGEGNAGLVGC